MRISGSARHSTAQSIMCAIPEHLMRVMSTNPSFLQFLRRRAGQESARLGHPARPALPGAETLVHHPRTGGQRIAEALAPRHGQCALARGQGRCHAGLAGGGSRQFADRMRAPTSRMVFKATRSTRIRRPGSRRSIAQAQLTSRRRFSTGAGWRASRSARWRQRKRTWPRSGLRCAKRRRGRRQARSVKRRQARVTRPAAACRHDRGSVEIA